jgi:hypothetical protein
MIRILLSSSHSSSASTTRTYKYWQVLPFSFDSGRRTSCCHWSRRDWFAISLRSVTASQMFWWILGMLLASCKAILVTNLPAWLMSPPPREKKKLAPRLFRSKYVRATVRAIVDFPVPAKPLSQKMHRSSLPSAHLYISRRTSTRVFLRHVGSCCFIYELNGASLAYGKLLSGLSSPNFLVSAQFQIRRGLRTDIVRVSKVIGASADMDILVAVSMQTSILPAADGIG